MTLPDRWEELSRELSSMIHNDDGDDSDAVSCFSDRRLLIVVGLDYGKSRRCGFHDPVGCICEDSSPTPRLAWVTNGLLGRGYSDYRTPG